MTRFTRRQFIQGLGLSGAGLLVGGCARGPQRAAPHVVVLGGGFGGATCAKYLRRYDPGLKVTLVERNARYVTCPGSNWVLGGTHRMEDITHDYDALRQRHGVEVVQDTVVGVDPGSRQVRLQGGSSLSYDRLVVAPGIDFRWDAIEGYDEAASEMLPHAWKAGPQTELLHRQLQAMPDGGTVILSVPGNPFRCPPGPYERASMIAHYLTRNKPKSKILILDAKDAFSKQGLFTAGWEALYPGMIEWVAGSQGGAVDRVDAAERTLFTEAGFTRHQGDVVNVIPPQQAGNLARLAGLTNDEGWCPVDQRTFESTVHPQVHVIGDACIAGAMPKSGHSANNQAKMAAAAIVASLAEVELPVPSHVNTCYSLVGPEYGISVAGVYRLEGDSIVSLPGGGVSPGDAGPEFRQHEARYATGWYASITSDTFG